MGELQRNTPRRVRRRSGTGRPVKFAAWDLIRVEDGPLSTTQYCDVFTLMNQIGAAHHHARVATLLHPWRIIGQERATLRLKNASIAGAPGHGNP